MSRRRVGVVLVAIAWLGAMSGVAEAKPAKTIVALYGHNGSTEEWQGQVGSEKSSCIATRKVTVYRKKPGKDAKIGTGRSNQESGAWFVDDTNPADGTYYAKVKQVGNKCKAAKSEELRYQDD